MRRARRGQRECQEEEEHNPVHAKGAVGHSL
jgi:hypothetical protein